MVERARRVCGRVGYRGVRESADGDDAGACASVGGERHPHYRGAESGRAGVRSGLRIRIRSRADEDSRRDWIADAAARDQLEAWPKCTQRTSRDSLILGHERQPRAY